MRVLMLGCGSRLNRQIRVKGRSDWTGQTLMTVDSNSSCNPDLVWDLNITPWPLLDGLYAEVHAYEILEHLGRQGDAASFFATFYQIWRVLEPGGMLAATVPRWDSIWAWGDPSHTRIISEGTLSFLDQTEYPKQVGKTPMSDFRGMWRGDFRTSWTGLAEHNLQFVLEAIKPPRT